MGAKVSPTQYIDFDALAEAIINSDELGDRELVTH